MENVYDTVFSHLGNDCIHEMEYNQHYGSLMLMNKPSSGFWGSKYTPGEEYRSSWDRYNSKNQIKRHGGKQVLFKVKKNAPVLVLDDIKEIDPKYVNMEIIEEKEKLEAKLMEMKPADEGFLELLFEYNAVGLNRKNKLMNWRHILEDFKGVYLTEEALYGIFGPAFNLWDVESIVIFDTSIIEEYIEDK